MAPTPDSTNYSLFSIPAYLLLSLAPHFYSGTLLKSSSSTQQKAKSSSPSSPNSKPQQPRTLYNLANPRSSANTSKYSSSLPPATYARWERARAAHTNMQENAAFFVSAVLAGLVTRCEAGFMNRMVSIYLLSRVAYIVSYVTVERAPLALLRTLWFTVGNGVLFGLWWVAGRKVMAGQY